MNKKEQSENKKKLIMEQAVHLKNAIKNEAHTQEYLVKAAEYLIELLNW